MTRVFKADSGQPLEIQHAGGSAALTVETDGDIALTQDIYLAAGKGIYFDGGTTSANYLGGSNAYEEGIWTPLISGDGGSTASFGSGWYTKIGRVVHANVQMSDVTFPAYSGTLYCSLPFSSASVGYWVSPDCYFHPNSAWDTGANFNGFVASLANSNKVSFRAKLMDGDRQTSIGSSNTVTEGASGLYLSFVLTYITVT